MGHDGHKLQDWRIEIALLALILVSAILFLGFPGLDMFFAKRTQLADGTFLFAGNGVAVFFNDFIERLAMLWVALALVGVGASWWLGRAVAGLNLRQYGFLIAALAVGPGLVANLLFKNQWGRARPRNIMELGGDQIFTPALIPTDQCLTNCSFVSGDASVAFATLAFALIAPSHKPYWISAAVAFGVLIGAVRMGQGAHFLSDVVFAGLFMALVVVVLRRFILAEKA